MSLLWSAKLHGTPESDLGLVARTNWLGAPYLATNPAGDALSPFRVVLVINPRLATNQGYQTRLRALVAAQMSDQPDETLGDMLRSLERAGLPLINSAAPTGFTSAHLNQVSPATPDAGENIGFWPSRIQRWALFVLVMLFLARRVWRYFHEVDDDDDFADHLATLAAAYRWVFPVYLALLAAVAAAEYFQIGNFFLSLSVLMLASSLRKYYCEAQFANNPGALRMHLALRCLLIWVGWAQGHNPHLTDLTTWFHWPILGWIVLALATAAFSQFYNNPDLSEHRRALHWFAAGFLVLGLAGAACAFWFWRENSLNPSTIWPCLAVGVMLGWSPLLGFFWRWSKNAGDQMAGRMIFDMILSEAGFAEKPRREKRLPHVLLLRHWRDRGDVEKAWHVAQTHLLKEGRALPVWLFALETAVLYRRKPEDALQILNRLCESEAFSYDQRTVAVVQVQGWMAAAGFPFDSARFKIERPPLQPTALTNQVEQKCREGRFAEAAAMLQEILAQDSLSEEAFIQLVRLYAQDLKNRPAAQKLIDGARESFSPKLLDFLSRTVDEWMRMPIRSQLLRRTWFDRLLGKTTEEPGLKKISVITPPIAQPPAPPEAADPLVAYLERVKEAEGKPPDTSAARDPVEKLLLERRLGTAVELLKQQAQAEPGNFELWLRYAEAYGHHCGNIHTAQKIIEHMDRSRQFKKTQMKKAYNRLKKWRKKHALNHANW